jgi:tRNA(Ile)-lysidine synthase
MAPGGNWKARPFEYAMATPGTVFVEETGMVIKVSETDRLSPDNIKGRKELAENPRCAFFDMDCVSFPIVVRSVRPGDRFRPLGLAGRQKLKKFFVDQKVPPEERKRVPILESGGRIFWVAGYRIDDSFKVAEGTKRVLKAELIEVGRGEAKFSLPKNLKCLK